MIKHQSLAKDINPIKMQSAVTLSSSPLLPSAPPPTTSLISSPPKFLPASINSSRFASIRSNGLSVNYNSTLSVFPAEACETIGGDSCLPDTCPEVKLELEANKPKMAASEPIEREYLDYTDPRTVLLGEACDVLGGEFCESSYQTGIC